MQIAGQRSAVAPEQWASLDEFRRHVFGRGGRSRCHASADPWHEVVVVGGSAITAHVPDVHTSRDIDFAVTSGIDRRRIVRALNELGFQERGRVFVHPETVYTLDFIAETPYIDREPVSDFTEIHTPAGSVRVLHLEDAIADRVAAFLHWSDSESLGVAERSAATARDHLAWERIDAALRKLDTSSPEKTQRITLARERLRRAIAGRSG